MIDTEAKANKLALLIGEKFLGTDVAISLKGGGVYIDTGCDGIEAIRIREALALSSGIIAHINHKNTSRQGISFQESNTLYASLDEFTPEAIDALRRHQEPMRLKNAAPAPEQQMPGLVTLAKAQVAAVHAAPQLGYNRA